MELTQTPYHFSTPYASIAGTPTRSLSGPHSHTLSICSDHLFHLDHLGRPFWFNGSLFREKREKDKGWFLPTHWAEGNGDWDADAEPWCSESLPSSSNRTNTNDEAVRGVRDVELRSLTVGGYDRVLTDMIGMAASWEAKFPELVQRHCDAMNSLQS